MPISRRRSVAMYESTPYVPIAARSRGEAAERQQARPPDRFEHRIHLPQADDRHRWIGLAHGAFDSLSKRSGGQCRAQHDTVLS